jgi:GT2 family glycosyltransferase
VTRTLSIGITTKNRPAALRACVESLAVLKHLDPEVLVFDDGSDEAAEQQLTGVCAARPDRILRDETSPGYIAGRNQLVRAAQGQFVLLLDDDTRILTGGAIESAVDILRRDARVGAVAFAQAEADGRPWPASMQPSPASTPALVPSFIGFAHLLHRDLFLELGGYRESFGFYGEEKDFCLRLLDAGYLTVYLPEARIAHVPDESGRSRQRYLRFVARNDCLNTLYNDPLTRVAWMLPARFGLYFRMRRRWRIDDPWGWAWLIRQLVAGLPDVAAHRNPVSRHTVARWQALRREVNPYAIPVSDASAGCGG